MITPGPWWVEKSRWFRARVCAESALSASSTVAASIYYEDDARAIAALPDVLGALRAMTAEAAAKGYELQSIPAAQRALAKAGH